MLGDAVRIRPLGPASPATGDSGVDATVTPVDENGHIHSEMTPTASRCGCQWTTLEQREWV